MKSRNRLAAILLPLFLLVFLLQGLWREDGPVSARMVNEPPAPAATRPEPDSAQAAAPAVSAADSATPLPPPSSGAAWAEPGEDGFTPRTRELAAGLDEGSPLLVRTGDGPARKFLMRPVRLFGDDFQITLGARRDNLLNAGVRAYEGKLAGADSGDGARTLIHAAVTGGAFAATVTESDGSLTYLRTDEKTGKLRALRRTPEQEKMTCEEDAARRMTITKSDSPPVTEADWDAAPEAEIELVVLASSGFDPETGRLDKYVQPIATGNNYELSLRECLSIITLDKSVTGANNIARLTQITSEYLAKAANLAAIQENNLGMRYLLQELILTPDDAAYTDVPNTLDAYGSWISGRRPRGTYHWDLSTKFGNGGFGGSTIGLAWVRSLGSTSPVNVCAKGFNVALEAHEQGHNLGSDHASGGIMNPSIINDSRDFFTDVAAGETAAKQIYDHAASRLTGSAVMRHPEQMPWANDDSADTPAGQVVDILPLANDLKAVRNGLTNAVLRIEELSRVYPIHAGTAVLVTPDRVRFTPAAGYQGQAWFSYSLRGSTGNSGAGWLHKGDVAVQIGAWDRNNLNLRLAPGQEFTFRPSSGTDTTIVSQPARARVDTARDDRHLIIIRVLATATGTDSFVIQRDGANSTVNITYVTDFLQTRPDVFTMLPGQASLRFLPMANDQGAGYRDLGEVKPIIGNPSTNAVGVSYFPGAFRLVSAVLDTPAKGTLSLTQRYFTINSVATLSNSGPLNFTPAVNARGVAKITYTVQDASGAQQSNTALIILPLGEILSPSAARVMIAPQHGVILEAATRPAAEPPLTGVIAVHWSAESAPGGASVIFDDAAAVRTGAYFSHAGEYKLRLTLTDNGYSTAEEVTVIVEPSATGPADALVAWWKLDEASGTAAADSSGQNHPGTLTNGPVRGAGAVGSSVTLDGTNDYIELSAHAAAVQNLVQGSISLWFKTDTGSLRPVFSASDNRDPDRSLRIYLEAGVLKYKVLGDLDTDVASLASPGTANDNEWHHAAVTVDAGRNAKLYLDGVLVREGIRPFFNAVFNLNSMAIGRTVRSDGVDYWRGGVDDVRIYSRPLNGDEVLSLSRLPENRGPVIALAPGPVTTGSLSLNTAVLSPAVTDDGRPQATPSRNWSATGPPGVVFSAPTALISDVTAPSTGAWKLRLEAYDGAVRTWRETPVLFTGSNPGAPWCVGFQPVRTSLGSAPVRINLFDVFGDPDGTDEGLTFTVTGNTNPALFASVAVSAAAPRELVLTFPPAQPGTADLTVRATDAGGASVEGVLRVTVENFAPAVPQATFSIAENSAVGTVAGTVSATDPEGAALNYEITGGNTLDAFAIHPQTGQITVTTPFALDHEARPLFNLTVRVSESAQPASFTTAEVLIVLTNENEAPLFAPQNFILRTGAAAGTSVGSLTAVDPEGNPVAFVITAGNTGGAFAVDANGMLNVANAAALNILTTPRFTLTITASDDAAPAAASTSTIRVTLEEALVAQGAVLRWNVPSAAPADGYAWTQRLYTDTAWQAGSTGIGYDTGTGYDSLIATDVQAAMFNLQPSLFMRIPFTVADAAKVGRLTLRMKYEDGYWAWINGTEAVNHGAPDPVAWNSAATGDRDEDAAVTFRDDDVTARRTVLITGTNVLAVQGLNETAASSDLIISPELVWSQIGTAAVPDAPLPGVAAASLITAAGATFSGTLTSDGGAAATVVAWFGRTDGGSTPSAWERSLALPGTRASGGSLTVQATGLRADTVYYVRYSAANSGGEGWSADAASFRTLPSAGNDYPSWIAGYPSVPTALAGPATDADIDGLTNFAEYCLGGNPGLGSDAVLLQPVVVFTSSGGQRAFEVTYRRRLDRASRSLTYQVELAPGVSGGWSASAGTDTGPPLSTGDGVTERITQRFLLPAADAAWFVRLRVQRG